MRRLSVRLITLFLLVFALGIYVCDAQPPAASGPVGRTKAGLFARLFERKHSTGIKKPRSAARIIKDQEKKKKKKDEEYAKSVKATQQRTYKIQTPEVQARMKQNQKDIIEREKARKKKVSESSQKARKKYKK